MKKLNTDLVKSIARCYSALGERPRTFPTKLSYYHCLWWRNHVMSPMIPLSPRIAATDLEKWERHLRSNRVSGEFNSKKPYLVIPDDKYYNFDQITTVLDRLEWARFEQESVNVINIWTKPERLELPKQIYFTCGRYFQPQIRADFYKVMDACSDLSYSFKRDLDKTHRKIEERLKTVILYNSRHAPIGAGLVATRDRYSYLYCGAIVKPYRGKGLWRTLIAARQAVSATGPNHMWATSTQNPRIVDKGDMSFRLRLYYKP